MKRLYSSEFDFSLAMLGISPTDPLSHFSFLTNMNKDISSLVSDADIANAAILSDPEEFVSTIKSFESKLAKSGIIIPIGHFPGVTVRKSDLEVDHNLSFGWGIQAWSIRGH